MANLFTSNLTEEELAQIIAESPVRPILPHADSQEWSIASQNPVIKKWMVPLRAKAELEIDEPLPELTDALYQEFHKTGARINFESVYFERRRRFGRMAVCALLDAGDPRWLRAVRRMTAEILDEFSWALPAHINTVSGKDPMHIDVFAGETANLMAHLIDLFGSDLGDDIVGKIKWRLRNQFFENYVNRHDDFFWMLSSGNWNAMCHQGIVGPALTFEEDPQLLAKMLMFMKRYLPVFLTGYGSDGGCSEGPAYWQYGFGWFCALNEQLEIRTNGRLSLVEGDEKISLIARYGPRTSLRKFHFVNFSDSLPSGTINPWLLSYLSGRLQDSHLRLHAHLHYSYLREHGINLHAQRCDLFYLTRLLLHCPLDLPAEVKVGYEDVFFKDLGLLVAHGKDARGNHWDFAAKGGHNNEQHNHNDCGSFIVNINGVPMITEIGAPEYTKDYFREHRYNYLAARTLGHSLPIVNGCEQAAGLQYAARVMNIDMEPDTIQYSVDLTFCYPSNAECGEVVRDFKWDKAKGRLLIKDYYELTKHESFETSIITDKEVAISGNEAVITSGDCKLIVRLLNDTLFAGIEEHEYRDHNGQSRKIQRIIIKPQELEEQSFLSYEIVTPE